MAPIFYNGFNNLKIIKRTKSFKVLRIENIITEFTGEKRLTLKMIFALYAYFYLIKGQYMSLYSI